jgi:hypothetical protein
MTKSNGLSSSKHSEWKVFPMSNVLSFLVLCQEVVWQLKSMMTLAITSEQKRAKTRRSIITDVI